MLRKKSTFQQRYKRNQEALVVFFLAGVSRSRRGKLSVYQHKGMYQLDWMAIQGYQKAAHHNDSASI